MAGDGPKHGAPSCSPPAHWAALSVLIVEDHQAYRALMGWFLQKLGLGYELVANGELALNAMALRDFDLVISDCRMPVLDGYCMAREIRRREAARGCRRVPIIALTARLTPDDARRCLEAGMDAWLLKPLSLEGLHEALELWLPQPPCEGASAPLSAPGRARWPTRPELVETFGDEQLVSQMLRILLREAERDYAVLVHACLRLDKEGLSECLHRLVGGLVFLGGTDLDCRASQLIERIHDHGIRRNWRELKAFERDLMEYLQYLTDL